MSETKKEKFTRLAVRRVNKIAKQLEGIGNLGNSYQYESTQDERDRIEEYLTGKLEIQLKNAVSKQRAQNRGIDVKPFIHDHVNFIGFIETRVQEAFNTDNPFDLEQLLDQTRWDLAEEFIGVDHYGFSKLAAYAIQLRIVHKWYDRNNEKGQTNLEDTITKNTESDSDLVKL